MKNTIHNPTFLKEEYLAYINDVLNRVFNVKSEDIINMGTDFDNAAARLQKRCLTLQKNWEESKLGLTSMIEGLNYGQIKLLMNYVSRYKQRSIQKIVPIQLNREKILGKYANTGYVPLIVENQVVEVVTVPQGYNGNNSFVEFGLSKFKYEASDLSTEGQYFENYFDSQFGTSDWFMKDAVSNLFGKLNSGTISFYPEKTEKQIFLKVNGTGIDTDAFVDEEDAYIHARITFFGRGTK